MIGKLKGLIDSASEDYCIIDVNGVGYLVYCSSKTLSRTPIGEAIELLIETHVREDHIHLYGFYNLEEKSAFTILQSVKGVGTRMALAILSQLSPAEIQSALLAEDKAMFNQVSGVGKKLSERIITELKDKIISSSPMNLTNKTPETKPAGSIANDAILALAGLGINRADAQNRVSAILANSPDISINDLIRLALKN